MLTPTQREILEVLIELYEEKKDLIRGEDIAKVLGRSPGTIRNQMQTLRALNYVEGVPGPKGGYIPALKAYEEVGISPIENPARVFIYRNEEKIPNIYAQKIVFTKIPDPHSCNAVITVIGDTRKINDDDIITVGPTPVNHVIVRGRVIGRDDTKRELLLEVLSVTSIPKGKVSDLATKTLISLRPNMSIKECAKVLVENRINGAPIIENGKLVGILTESEIVDAISRKDWEKLKAKDIAIKEVYTIDENDEIITCVNKMLKYDVGRLIVVSKGKPVGIITRTDILMRLIK